MLRDARVRSVYTSLDLLEYTYINEPMTTEFRASIELLMFPHLFLEGKGYYQGILSFVDYCTLRSHQMFSIHTVNPVYVLMLYNICQVYGMLVTDYLFVVPGVVLRSRLRSLSSFYDAGKSAGQSLQRRRH